MLNIARLIEHNRSGQPVGLPCFCTANEHVLQAILQHAADKSVPVVIEATCNQVNQDGGYTGLLPADFAQWINTLAIQYGVEQSQLVLGGDHLGPNPWRSLPANEAMAKAEVLVRDYAAAGFSKIHLDASMACGGEDTPSFKRVAERAARLCRIAEDNAPEPENLIYIIGTEVPIPGGETDDMDELAITSNERFLETIETHREAFEHHGLMDAWPRIVSIVTQPGVDFSHSSVHRFKPSEITRLSQGILNTPGLSFEAHSTDYQPTDALAELVASHFFFLKVGPELTFRMREAVFALCTIENQLVRDGGSNLIAVIDAAMEKNPGDWSGYYVGDKEEVKQLRHYSYSDRIRYYWNTPEVKAALGKLLDNLESRQVPETLISQFFQAREFGGLNASPRQLIADHVNRCVERYYRACGY